MKETSQNDCEPLVYLLAFGKLSGKKTGTKYALFVCIRLCLMAIHCGKQSKNIETLETQKTALKT